MQYIEYKPLEKIAEITRGVSWKSGEESSEKSFENIRAYKIPHIIKNKKYVSEDEPLYIKKYKKHEAKLLTYNDILMITSNGNPNRVGNISLYKSREIAVPASFLLKISGKEVVEQEFLYYFLSSDKAQGNITGNVAGSTGLRNINMASLKGLKVPVPPLKEQQKISEILSTVDEQIEQTDQLIEKTTELKKGLMQQLLTKGIGHNEFTQSEFGEVPINWNIMKFEDCFIVFNGYAFKSSNSTENGIVWVKIANIGINKMKWNEKSYLPLNFSEKYKEYQIKNGDILLAMTRPILNRKMKISRYKENFISLLNQRVATIKVKNTCDSEFIYQVLRSGKFVQKLQYLIAGTDPPNVSPTQIHQMMWPIPPIKEQKKIAEILFSVDEDIEGYEEEKAKYEELKKGLMQQLLTGKTRVKID